MSTSTRPKPGDASGRPKVDGDVSVARQILNARDAVFHHRPDRVHQIGSGRPLSKVTTTNQKGHSRLHLPGDGYKGGWYKDHAGPGTLSDRGLESNHMPPKAAMKGRTWQYRDKHGNPLFDENGDPVVWTESKASAVELDYEDHRILSTTGGAAKHTQHMADLNAALDKPDMEQALVLEITDLKSKLASNNAMELNDPNSDSSNHHGRPYKDPDRYDEAIKDMIRECYPNLLGSKKLEGLLGP
jgi:hypothetical protein